MSRFFGVFLMFPVTKGRNKKSILLYEKGIKKHKKSPCTNRDFMIVYLLLKHTGF